ncbi:MAG: YceI family protein [Candidatus Marinimicrobia bacterium]|nr:YceI family protein [Candidatus Neomarinimicrobiota bacterium]
MERKLVILLLSIFSVSIQAQIIDRENSIVNFSVSNMRVNIVTGSFKGMDGEIKFDEKDLKNSSFNVCIEAATVNTENVKRDAHLRNKDFFHVEKYPKICFESSNITKTENGFFTIGKLTMHGITKEEKGEFLFDGKKFWGKVKVHRLDYQIGKGTNTFMVGDEVDLEIICILKN